MAFGEKAYKCVFEGCGRLYTTLHHMKVMNVQRLLELYGEGWRGGSVGGGGEEAKN